MITAGSCSPRVLVCSEAQQVTQHVAKQVLTLCFRVLCQYVVFHFKRSERSFIIENIKHSSESFNSSLGENSALKCLKMTKPML